MVSSTLPDNQRKKLVNKIINGTPENFLVQNIPEGTSLYKNNKKLFNDESIKKIVIKKVNKTVHHVENDNKIIQLLDLNLLDKKAYGNWDDWAKVGMAMKSSNPIGIDNFIRFSKINKDKYDKHETVEFWEGIKVKDENENKLSMGTLMKWAKESNKDIYNMTI